MLFSAGAALHAGLINKDHLSAAIGKLSDSLLLIHNVIKFIMLIKCCGPARSHAALARRPRGEARASSRPQEAAAASPASV